MEAGAIVSQPRYHHQYLPDTIFYETGAISEANVGNLRSMGHELKALQQTYGNMHIVIWDKQANTVSVASDPRGEGKALLQ